MKAYKGLKSQRSRCGFTLVEIMIVVVIIGLLAALATPAFQQVRDHARASAFINDLRIARDSIQIFTTENGRWPEDTNPSEIPDSDGANEFVGYMADDFWSTAPTVGGEWDYEGETSGIVPNNGVGISVIGPDLVSVETMERVDRAFDDGNFATGKFRLLQGDRYTLILKE